MLLDFRRSVFCGMQTRHKTMTEVSEKPQETISNAMSVCASLIPVSKGSFHASRNVCAK